MPKRVRLWWGALKNLLSGVTTVCHHNPLRARSLRARISQSAWCAASRGRTRWSSSRDLPSASAARRRITLLSSIAPEGRDAAARRELQTLDDLGALDARTVVVHGVGITGRARST